MQTATPQTEAKAATTTPKTSSTSTEGTKGNLLEALRSKYGDRYTIQAVKDPIPLTIETLQPHWNDFAANLKEENKTSQANAFSQARLEILDETTFNIQIDSTLQQKFIEQEKSSLSEYLQGHYHTNLISFSFVLHEGEKEVLPMNKQLNSKQRFERMAEKNPLLRTLRDNLRLEIDYKY